MMWAVDGNQKIKLEWPFTNCLKHLEIEIPGFQKICGTAHLDLVAINLVSNMIATLIEFFCIKRLRYFNRTVRQYN